MTEIPKLLQWAREIQALAQTGLHFAKDEFQKDRCNRLLEIAADMISSDSDADFMQLAKIFKSQTGYATPRIDVRGAVFRDGNLLFVRERLDGGWTLPGGWADVGDLPSRAAEREVWEEAGFRVKATKVIGIYDANRLGALEIFHAFKIVFLCEIIDGVARPSKETSEVKFFSREDLPRILSNQRTNRRHIDDAFAALADKQRPAVFD